MIAKARGVLFGAVASIAVVALMGATSGGFPSRPRFQAVGLNRVAPGVGEVAGQTNANGTLTWLLDNDSNGTANAARLSISSGDANAALFVAGSGLTSTLVTGGPTGAQAVMRGLGNYPLIFATSNTSRMQIDGAGTVSIAGALQAGSVEVNGSPISPPLYAYKTAASTRTSDATATQDNHLVISGLTGTGVIYAFEASLLWGQGGGVTTNGIRVQPTASGGTTIFRGWVCRTTTNISVANTAEVAAYNNPGAGVLAYTNTNGGSGFMITCRGTVEVNTAGTVAINWGQNTSSASATTLSQGSWIRLERIQ